jgi:type III secretory pathway component EscR
LQTDTVRLENSEFQQLFGLENMKSLPLFSSSIHKNYNPFLYCFFNDKCVRYFASAIAKKLSNKKNKQIT